MDTMTLLPLDSPEDLVLRGFSQDEISADTGIDVGYHGSKVRSKLTGLDRMMYKVEHVRQRCSGDDVRRVLVEYRDGASKADVLVQLGLRGENIIKLKVLFNELGMGEMFVEFDLIRRRNAMRDGVKSTYGVDNVFELSNVQDAAKNTRVEKYGAAYTFDHGSSLSEKARQTAASNMSDPEFKHAMIEKRQKTLKSRYGYTSPLQVPEFLEKARRTSFERYGSEHYMKVDDHRTTQSRRMLSRSIGEVSKSSDLRRATCMLRYGVSNYTQTEDARSTQSAKMLDPVYQSRVIEAKKSNGTLNSSSVEEKIQSLLVAYFGDNDVSTQYRDERYPFACDFYVESRDLFVEVNGLWTHGPHWFNALSNDDLALKLEWESKSSAYYAAAVEQWCVRDVEKRRAAVDHELNYLVVWGASAVAEVELWLAAGAPNARDWQREYSWLPDRQVTTTFEYPRLEYGQRRAIQAAKACNGRAFYRRELDLWSANPRHSKGGTAQSRLYANRFAYLGRTPSELTDVEILNGLGISGALRRYTTFNADGMKRVINDHDATSIYDPCAGWGERLFTCASLGVTYTGLDVNSEVVAGHHEMIQHYGLTSQMTTVGDAATHDMRDHEHDVVFTCPPYGNTEIYTEFGAENLDAEEFIEWWCNVVEMSVSSSTRVFAYQINQKWKNRLNDVLLDRGWRLDSQIEVGRERVGHFNRARSGKREFEEVQVFVRDVA